MNREIKFRAFIEDYGEMYSVISVFRKSVNEDFQRIFIDKEAAEGHPANYRVGDGVYLMQFTGFKDVNGIDIYEGDIVRKNSFSEGYALPIIWRDCMFLVGEEGMSPLYNAEWYEVIGNIYENPELLPAPRTKKQK